MVHWLRSGTRNCHRFEVEEYVFQMAYPYLPQQRQIVSKHCYPKQCTDNTIVIYTTHRPFSKPPHLNSPSHDLVKPLLRLVLPPLIPHAMDQAQVFPHQILREPIKRHVLGPQPIRRRDAAHTRHLVHVHQRPGAGIQGGVLAIDEHHAGHDADVMLPPVTELVPPLLENDLVFGDMVGGP